MSALTSSLTQANHSNILNSTKFPNLLGFSVISLNSFSIIEKDGNIEDEIANEVFEIARDSQNLLQIDESDELIRIQSM